MNSIKYETKKIVSNGWGGRRQKEETKIGDRREKMYYG
jgi:hypothetical protein